MKIIERLVLITTFLQTILMWGCEKEEALKCEKINKEAEIGKVFCIRAKPVVLNPASMDCVYCEVLNLDTLGTCGEFEYGNSWSKEFIRMVNGIFLYGYDDRKLNLQIGVEYNFRIRITEKIGSGIFEDAGPSKNLNHAEIIGVDVCPN